MLAQSHASVPPAPALMLRMQLFLSCGPLRKTFSSSASSCLEELRDIALKFLLNFRLRLRRLGLAEFDHHPEIVELLFRLEQGFDLCRAGCWPRQ